MCRSELILNNVGQGSKFTAFMLCPAPSLLLCNRICYNPDIEAQDDNLLRKHKEHLKQWLHECCISIRYGMVERYG